MQGEGRRGRVCVCVLLVFMSDQQVFLNSTDAVTCANRPNFNPANDRMT